MNYCSNKVQIVMPTYNVERTIGRTIDSILCQTYRNFELIIVDDGSTDNTVNIINEYLNLDSRIKKVLIKNSGPACARNIGLSFIKEKAEYTMFCDADDILCIDAIEKSVSVMNKNKSDLVIMGFDIVNKDNSRNSYYEDQGEYCLETNKLILEKLYKANLLNQVWGKLFRTEVIDSKKIEFQNYKWGEDRLFVFEYLLHIKNISVISDCEYLYIMQNSSSLVNCFYDKKVEVCIKIDKKINEVFKYYSIEKNDSLDYMFTKSIFSCIVGTFASDNRLSTKKKKDYIKYILENEYVQEHCDVKTYGIVIRVLAFCIRNKRIYTLILLSKISILFAKYNPNMFLHIKHKK